MTAAERRAEKARAIEQLREILPPGSTACTILRHVSRSGMNRDISIIVNVPGENEPRDVTYLAARAMNEPLRESNGYRAIRVGGCGMDMGFAIVYRLAWTLYHDALATIAPEHTNGGSDTGYAIRQRWI